MASDRAWLRAARVRPVAILTALVLTGCQSTERLGSSLFSADASTAAWAPPPAQVPSAPYAPVPLIQAAHVVLVQQPHAQTTPPWRPAERPSHRPQPGETGNRAAYPIDLPTALRLAGAQNLDIQLARAALEEAAAGEQWASVLWYPSIRLGAEYVKHEGKLQETVGPVLEISRNAGFIGGGLLAEFRLSEALYAPLAARQQATAAQNRVASVTNEVLLAVTQAYFELVQAEADRLILERVAQDAETIAELTRRFAETGQGLESDAARAEAELQRRKAELAWAAERVAVASARLARLLRLDPAVQLKPVNAPLTPLQLVGDERPLEALIHEALTRRPEVLEQNALVQAELARLRQERMRAWLPELNLGLSAGGYGGGEGAFFGDFGDRSDLTVGAFWSWRNLGAGEDAARRIREARYRQATLAASRLADEIAQQVSIAYARLRQRQLQLQAAQAGVRAAQRSLELNFKRIRGAEGLPIEALDALRTLASAQQRYIEAVTAYNRAQFELAWATGQSLEQLVQRGQATQSPQSGP